MFESVAMASAISAHDGDVIVLSTALLPVLRHAWPWRGKTVLPTLAC